MANRFIFLAVQPKFEESKRSNHYLFPKINNQTVTKKNKIQKRRNSNFGYAISVSMYGNEWPYK